MSPAILVENGWSNVQIARMLGVTEGTVRYRRRRRGLGDGRANQVRLVQRCEAAIRLWMDDRRHANALSRPPSVRALCDWLVLEHGWTGSYKAVLRFVRSISPPPKLRPFRRVETPPGAQAQVDWGEFDAIDLGDGPQTVFAFVMVLSHSRQEAVVWRRQMNQLAWQQAHLDAFRRLGGVPAVLRIDNLKTGIARGAGPWSQINDVYRAFARSLGFHIDACLPRAPEHKGKVENMVRQLKRRLPLHGRRFDGLPDLQATTDRELALASQTRICPPTGLTVEATWRSEQARLRPLPEPLPTPFDTLASRKVQPDCTIYFANRAYSVPFVHIGQKLQVRAGAELVQVLHEGKIVAEHPRNTQQRLVLDPRHYEGPGNDRVSPPTPLGRMGRKLQEINQMSEEDRPKDLYAALAGVAR